jgi:hypothetical protein
VTGQLIYHRTVWFSQKNVTLFNGADSPVSVIAWRGNIVAWGDATQVRIMDLSTQSAICFLNCPQGVSAYSPLPCCLFWESECDILIGWADSVRHVELSTTPGGVGAPDIITARSVIDWETDCIVCGISSFDADHVVLLGYAPPVEEDLGTVISDVYSGKEKNSKHLKTTGSGYTDNSVGENLDDNFRSAVGTVIGLNQPEIQIVLRSTGELISSDLLVLNHESMGGPSTFRLLSTYTCLSHGRDAQKWRLSEVLETCPRGGLRGLAPTLFILSPQDFVVARVRDVNDYIKKALDTVDLKRAVELAKADRLSLKTYRYADLVTLYIDDLLDRDRPSESSSNSSNASSSNSVDNEDFEETPDTVNHTTTNTNINSNSSGNGSGSGSGNTPSSSSKNMSMSSPKNNYLLALTQTRKRPTDYSALAARECQRLIGDDVVLWERWVYAFAKRRCLHHISPFIPIKDPRLSNTVYEVRTCVCV